MSPLGPNLRKPSRSPRSQRSRSADVDSLKKYTERKFEERKFSEAGDPRVDPSKWIPLSRNVNRLRSSTRSYSEVQRSDGGGLETGRTKVDSTRWIPVLNRKVCPERTRRSSQERLEDMKYVKQPASRSFSSESTFSRRDSYFRDGRNTEFEYYDKETFDKTRLLQSETSTSRYIPSPLARKYSEGSSSKPMSNRWMAFTKNPSSDPMTRKNPERRSFSSDTRKTEVNWSNRSRENMPSFSMTENKSIQVSKEPSIDSARLNQRIRELYDIKTETEWPRRLKHSLKESAWISKSSSEEEKYPIRTGRRNSQELEFNDRSSLLNEFDEKREIGPRKSTDSIFDNDWDERLKKFHERLRFSEDLGIDKKIHARDKRTYSDDYEDMCRRQSNDEYFGKEFKRNSDASSRSRVSYAEIDFSDFSKRGSRTSDASYVSISTYSPKRGSIESKGVSESEVITPQVFSQLEQRRPSTPVPPKMMNESVHIDKPFLQRSRRNSTRYKVYLT